MKQELIPEYIIEAITKIANHPKNKEPQVMTHLMVEKWQVVRVLNALLQFTYEYLKEE